VYIRYSRRQTDGRTDDTFLRLIFDALYSIDVARQKSDGLLHGMSVPSRQSFSCWKFCAVQC